MGIFRKPILKLICKFARPMGKRKLEEVAEYYVLTSFLVVDQKALTPL